MHEKKSEGAGEEKSLSVSKHGSSVGVLISGEGNANVPTEGKGPVKPAAHSLLKENITGAVWAGQCFCQISWRKNLDNFEQVR